MLSGIGYHTSGASVLYAGEPIDQFVVPTAHVLKTASRAKQSASALNVSLRAVQNVGFIQN